MLISKTKTTKIKPEVLEQLKSYLNYLNLRLAFISLYGLIYSHNLIMNKAATQLATLKEVAVQHLKVGKYQRATVYFRDILDKFQAMLPEIQDQDQMQRVIRQFKIPSHKNLSLCYLKLKKYQQCRSECEIVLDIEPNNVKFLYRMGRVLIQKKELDNAQNYLKRAFHIDPHEKEVMKALEEIEGLRNMKQPSSQTNTKSQLKDLILYLLSIIFWLPLMIYRKGKSVSLGLIKQIKKE